MNPAKWLQTATSTTELTLFHSIRLARLVRLVRLVRSCFVKNAPGAATFGYALNFNPRSMPILTGMSSGYLHPLVQNPRREFWRLTIIYACVTICVKLVFQLHVICVCDNMFSLAPNCPSEQNQQMCLQHYPELPYYHDEPMVTDWSLGLQKCFLSKVSGERGAGSGERRGI